MKIGDFLKVRGSPVITIGPDETVSAAIQKLVDSNIGALPVSDGEGTLLGIVSERDLLKECLGRSGAIGVTKVHEVMKKDVAVAAPDEDLDYAASVMEQKAIRHLPVVVGPRIEGMISMRDIVSMQLQEAEAEISYVGLVNVQPTTVITGKGRPVTGKYAARQGQYLAVIHYFTKIHGYAPSEADLEEYFRVSRSSVHRMLLTLEEHGLIVRTPGDARSIRVLLPREQLPDLW